MRIVLKNTIKVSAFLIFFLFLIALCLSSPSSSSFSITTFNDTTSAKNLTFTTSENKTAYIEIPRYVNVIDAKLNLSGYNYWGENTTFKSGIAGSSSAEMGFDIYTIDGLIQMIRVDYWGNLEGYTWNGTAWETNNTIISDLPTSTFNESKPGIYTIDNKPIMMINNHTWQNWIWGYEWNGTSWKRNNTFDYVASSAITSGADIASDIYTIDGLTHMIIGSYSGKFEGATWNGTDWIRNTTLETGLVGIDLGFRSRPAFYKLDGKIALISGNWTGKWTGWIWNGTQWINNTDVLNGLVQTDIESSGSIYTIDNKIVFVTYKANDKWRSYVYDHPNSPYLDVSGDGNIEWSLPDAEFQGSIAYLEKLNDSSTAKNSTFTTSENKTIWVKIPKNADVTDAKLNLSGYSVEESQNNNTDADISVRSNTPYYFAEDLWVGFDSAAGYEEFRAYLRFPLSLPDNIKIKNATLSLYKLVDIGAESANYDAHHVYDHTWDGEDDTSMRWSTQVCGVNFDDSTDCNLTAENSIQVSSGWNNWTVTNAVKKEYEEGDLNISFALRVASSIDDASKFDNMAGTYIPYLVVEYEYYPTSPYLDVGGDGDKQWEYGEDIDELKDDDGNILTGDYTYYMLVGDKTSQLLNITCVQPVDEFWILSINDEQKMLECSNGTQSLDETYVNSYAVNKIYFGGSGSHTDQLRLENPRDYVYNPGGEYNESVSPERTADFSQEINDYLSTCSPNANGECDVPLVLHSDTAGKIQISDIDIQYNYQTTPNFSSEINNILPACSCSGCSLSNDNCTFPLVVHSDTAGIIQLDALNITYEDVKAPLWNDTTGYLGSNASVISKGDPILLYGMGKDDIALDYAWLETNETGSWENKTQDYSSPMDMNDASNTWIWSNFTWQNSSITEGTTVGWRIYYNDTSGNENKTVINTFYIKQKFYPNMTQSVSVVDLIS
ncbi:MAG: DNRLRE domain-containing protein, partial [Candidatus Bathyarchaeia archaeon]